MPPACPSRADGLLAGRLAPEQYAPLRVDAHPPLTAAQAQIEAERCLYCHDAPCTIACPTSIDVPGFIHRIAQGNERGAARLILEANPLGGLCARVCPTEVLCEQACVRHAMEEQPVEIGALQRHATDAYFAAERAGKPPLFKRGPDTGRRVAVVGAGPAGLACAHGLARLGHGVDLYDAHPKLGGLNEYGLATYKIAGDFAQQEVNWLLSIGGIEVHAGQALGRDFTLESLLASHDAVFLGLGLAGVNALGIAEPALSGLRDAVDFIAELRQSDPATVAVGRRVIVIGGGMTAVDAAVQSRLLGAEEVHLVYRRGAAQMGASDHEQAWALSHGVRMHHWAAPREVLREGDRLVGMRFARTEEQEGRLVETNDSFDLPADQVLRAIGQRWVAPAGVQLQMRQGRLDCDARGRTSHPRVWAGGDCRAGGRDLSVEAVAHGRDAALSIDQALRA
ncbi:NAD(P)-dependent oxidoreductase [Inhella sp.]|uniref:NAD(P)-dependent oxidoreductase n=1 Tax=Inhella sp. TaxID=1921806 RepID=UPI0035AF0B93